MYKLIPNILPFIGLFVIIVLIGAIGKFLGYYVVVANGREDVTEEEVKSYVPKIKESKWIIVLVILTALAVLSFIVLVNIYR
jgi:NADH:ubiquinone oxidoreductase subunit 6 (subunit J)